MAKFILEGKDLASNEPDLIKDWNYENNNGMTPAQFARSSESKVTWKGYKRGCHRPTFISICDDRKDDEKRFLQV